MLKRLLNWCKGLLFADKPFKYKFVEDVPTKLYKRTVYIVGENNFYWQMVMLCPCGCNNVLHMNLMEEQSPSWSYSINTERAISIFPSVNRLVGCKSHFFVREGKIIWA
jgi:hypothetical protein